MRLSGNELNELKEGLLDAYNAASLKQMVRIKLDEDLSSIAGGSTLNDIVFNLIEWAEQHGRLRELVRGACNFNTGNEKLQKIAQIYKLRGYDTRERTTLIITISVNNLTGKDIGELIGVIAEKIGLSQLQLEVKKVEQGSTVVTLELPQNEVIKLWNAISIFSGDGNKVVASNWANEFNIVSLSMEGANLSHFYSRSHADLRGIDLRGAHLEHAHLGDSKLNNANLRGADMTSARLESADMTSADLAFSILWQADLANVNLQAANLEGANLHEASLRGANLREAVLERANLREAVLIAADLTGANLREAVLERAKYSDETQWPQHYDYRNSGAIGPEANLEGANLLGVNLSRSYRWQVHLRGANLRGANLEGANLHQTNLREAVLERANLREAVLIAADLTGANLREAVLERAKYSDETQWPQHYDYRNSGAIGPEANLEGANLLGVNLSRSFLNRAHLRSANLSRSNLNHSHLSGADLGRANLREADLSGVNLHNAYLSGINRSFTKVRAH